MPTAIIIAGPNGAGKTTFATKFLPKVLDCQRFINADLLAKGLSPLNPDREAFRAGRLMLQLIHESVEANETFAIETTLSSRNYLNHIQGWKNKGYQIVLLFIELDSPELAIRRLPSESKKVATTFLKPPLFVVLKEANSSFPSIAQLWTNGILT